MSRTTCLPISALRFYWKRFWLGFFPSTSKSQWCPKIKCITIVVVVIIIIFKVSALLIHLGGENYEVNWTFSDSALFRLRMQTFRIRLEDEDWVSTLIRWYLILTCLVESNFSSSLLLMWKSAGFNKTMRQFQSQRSYPAPDLWPRWSLSPLHLEEIGNWKRYSLYFRFDRIFLD